MLKKEKQPKILFFDIETTPNLIFSWGIGKTYSTHDSIYKERKVSCVCYKWAHEKRVRELHMDMAKHDINKYDDDADKEMLSEFSKVYGQADVVVAHNGAHFDLPTLKSRIIRHNLPPISPTLLDDTYIQSKPIRFNNHRLDYLGQFLNLGRKESTSYRLWVDIMHGSKRALKAMIHYCKQDVSLLEKIYNKLKPYVKTKLNLSVFRQDPTCCPSCGGKLWKDGIKHVGLKIVNQFECSKCHKKTRGGENSLAISKLYPREV